MKRWGSLLTKYFFFSTQISLKIRSSTGDIMVNSVNPRNVVCFVVERVIFSSTFAEPEVGLSCIWQSLASPFLGVDRFISAYPLQRSSEEHPVRFGSWEALSVWSFLRFISAYPLPLAACSLSPPSFLACWRARTPVGLDLRLSFNIFCCWELNRWKFLFSLYQLANSHQVL